MRATRDLLRRRCPLARKRAALFAHLHNTKRQSNLPEIGKRLANTATREEVTAQFPDPRVRKALAVEVSLLDHSDQVWGEVALSLPRTAKAHAVQTCARVQSVPGIGQMLAVVILYEIHDSTRLPRGQDFVSSCRLGKCATESSGKKLGTAGKKSGNAHFAGPWPKPPSSFFARGSRAKNMLRPLHANTAKPKR
jgi:Transposase IS116/IS110/IS902 family